jgi:hypothetical protein
MNTNDSSGYQRELSRRQFLKSSTLAAVAGPVLAQSALAQNEASAKTGILRVGLIGCGGRGTGAAAQALEADPNTKIVALGDAFKDRLQLSLETLKAQKDIADRVQVRC